MSNDLIADVIAEFDHSTVIRLHGEDVPSVRLSGHTVSGITNPLNAAILRAKAHHDKALGDAVLELAAILGATLVTSGPRAANDTDVILNSRSTTRLVDLLREARKRVDQHPDYMLADAIVQLIRWLTPVVERYQLEAKIYLASRLPAHYDRVTIEKELAEAAEGFRQLFEEPPS